MKSEEEEENKAEEPQADYSKRVTITTLEELEEQTREHTRNMTYEQRMEYLQQLISIVYGPVEDEQKKKFLEGRLMINKPR